MRSLYRMGYALKWTAAFLCIALPGLAQETVPQFDEHVQVRNYLLEVRAYDDKGNQIKDLTRDDWRLIRRYDELKVISSEWVDLINPQPEIPDGEPFPDTLPIHKGSAGGRLIVFYFQGESGFANRGYMRVTRAFKELVENLDPRDRVAVFSFDNHLKMQCDFTPDRSVAVDALERAANRKPTPEIRPVEGPSVARHFDFEKAKTVYASDIALKVIADALQPLKGPKTMVFVGWGLGVPRYNDHVIMPRRYEKSKESMQKANLTVFSFGYHPSHHTSTLGGLRRLAWDTGGEFLSSLDDLVDSMEGYHLLVVEATKPLQEQKFKIRLRNQSATVTYRMATIEEPPALPIESD